MCGIAGLFDPTHSLDGDDLSQRARRMADALGHRGPDDAGAWTNAENDVAFGHRRLSIIDLSDNGRQPMPSACGRFTLCYNGEIYNHRQLRAELQGDGIALRGHSDSEVLIEFIARHGIDETLPRLNGMFAFAVWDGVERRLSLVRDRMGIKPLYYGRIGRALAFGSELKAFDTLPEFPRDIDRNALGLFVQHCYIPAPRTIYQGVFKLPPGCRVDLDASSIDQPPAPEHWWSMHDTVVEGRTNPFQGDACEADDELQSRLADAVRLRRESDVPLGAFLSGGIDSSLVVSLLQSGMTKRLRTFTIGFDERDYDEAHYARRIAAHLGTDHVEHYVSPREARDVIPLLPEMFDEPFADSSQIPTYLVAGLARQHVTVSLSGDGGDEFFGGYERYRHYDTIAKKIGVIPAVLRGPLAAAIRNPVVRKLLRRGTTGRGELAGVLNMQGLPELYEYLNRHWRDPLSVVIGTDQPAVIGALSQHCAARGSRIEQMMSIDASTYLPDDILTKVDRATMAVSLEARVPLLDHNVVEFAWSLPPGMKFSGHSGKLPLRRILSRYVPTELFDRPKTGFGIPLDAWLRGPLREWAEDLISEQRLRRDGFFHPAPIRERWQQHLDGTADWHYLIWDILMFQAWFDAWKSR